MSSGRMLSKAISISEKVDDLKTAEAKLFYTWAIVHTDDFGLLPVSFKKLRAVVCPLWEKPKVEDWVKDIVERRLWQVVKFHDENFHYVLNFFEHQTLRKDINPKLWSNKDAKWDDFAQIRNQVDGNLFAAIGQKSEAPPQRKSVGSVDEVKKEIYAHKRFKELEKKYPHRNYGEVIEDMCEWWQIKRNDCRRFRYLLSRTGLVRQSLTS